MKTLDIIQIHEQEKWNTIVQTFSCWDIYYLNEYAHSLELHGDGSPYLIYFEGAKGKLCYVMMQNDLSKFPPLTPYLESNRYFDWTTPYGYGGPLVEGVLSDKDIKNFNCDLTKWCNNHSIISQFFRFHPILENHNVLNTVCDVIYLKKTVYIDTENKELIFKNMTPNNRNMVRKAQKNQIYIKTDKGELLESFLKIYVATMKKNHAESYYYFEQEYFDYIIKELKGNVIFFYAFFQDKPISSSIFFYNNTVMHYHLSGTLPEYRNLAAANLLLSEAANWAAERGIRKLHLGGGVDINDSLLSFKKHFNRNGLIDFYIGRSIFDQNVFDMLVKLRKENNPSKQLKPILIKYRG